MIYTVTLNPCLDYVTGTDGLKIGELNRTKYEEIYVGGKGINVSLVLQELGCESVCFGFLAGFVGDAIEGYLAQSGVETDFVRLFSGNSRINVKIKSGVETEINARGPHISEEEKNIFLDKLDVLTNGDYIIISGSVPPSLPDDIYETILKRIENKGVRAVVDASGALLEKSLKYRPFLIKPNNTELGELFGVDIKTAEDAEPYARKLKDMGAGNVLVSLGKEGALLIDEGGRVLKMPAFDGAVVNTVGAGDSMVAGFVAGMISGDGERALKLGCACGGATAFLPGLAKKENIEKLFGKL